MFAEDYLRRAVGQDYVVTSDPSEIRRFVQRELGLSFEPSQVAGLTLRRAEACLIRGRRGAMIVYERNGTVISHYLVPREGARPRTPTVSDYHEVPGGGRMPVVTWSTTSVDQALVGDVEVDVLLEIARSGAT